MIHFLLSFLELEAGAAPLCRPLHFYYWQQPKDSRRVVVKRTRGPQFRNCHAHITFWANSFHFQTFSRGTGLLQ